MSDTPRTNALIFAPNGNYFSASAEDFRNLCRQLEIENKALQARVKRLEEAGDNLACRLKLWKMEDGWLCTGDEEAFKDWQETKESKP